MNLATWKEMMSGGSKSSPKVISQLIESLKVIDGEDYLNQVTMLSARQKDLKKSLMQDLITEDQARVLQNKINSAVLFTLDEIDADNIFKTEVLKETEKVASAMPQTSQTSGPSASLDDIKKLAKEAQTLLFSLQNEKTMTMPGKAEIIIQKQIEETEKELNSFKKQIQTLISLS